MFAVLVLVLPPPVCMLVMYVHVGVSADTHVLRECWLC